MHSSQGATRYGYEHEEASRFKDSHDCTDQTGPTRCSRCKVVGHRRQHRDNRKVTAHAINEGLELAEDWYHEVNEDLYCWDYDDILMELWRLGLLYEDQQERGPGLTLNTITHREREFSLVYEKSRAARRRRATSRASSRDSLSPALSFVDVTSDEELAAFLSVYDYVDLGGNMSEDEGVQVV